MAVVVENEYNATVKKATSQTIASVVVPTSSDRGMYVLLAAHTKGAGDGFFATAVTFNGSESFTLLSATQVQNGKATVAVWYLADPTETTASVVVTWNNNSANWDGGSCGVQVVSGEDGHRTAEASSTGNGTSATHTITSTSGDYAVDIISSIDGISVTENGDGVQIWQNTTNRLKSGSADLETIGNASMGWTLGSGVDWVNGGVSVIPAAAADVLMGQAWL